MKKEKLSTQQAEILHLLPEETAYESLCEDAGRRSAHTRHFRTANGGYLAVVSGKGEIYDPAAQDYRNRKHNFAEDAAGLLGEEEDFQVHFPLTMTATSPIRMTANGHCLGFRFLPSNGKDIVYTAEVKEDKEKCVTYRRHGGRVFFRYRMTERGIKESTYVTDCRFSGRLRFLLESGDMQAILAEDGRAVQLIDREGKMCFTIPAPYMVDAVGERSDAISYRLSNNQAGTILTMEADRDWLHDPSRAYPVCIDPEIILPDSASDNLIEAVTLRSDARHPDTANYYVGYDSSGRAMKTCIKITPPALVDATIDRAELVLVLESRVGDCTQNVYTVCELLGDWAVGTVTPTTCPAASSTVLSRFYHEGSEGTEIRIDLTTSMQKWYNNPNTNYGIVIQPSSAVYSGNYLQLYTSDETQIACRPRLEIQYTDVRAYGEHRPRKSFENGRAGTTVLDLHTGDLMHVHTDFALDGYCLPLALSHIYHACDRRLAVKTGTSTPYGYGWSLSAAQTITLRNSGGVYAVYRDSTGMEYCFCRNSNGSITDDMALGLTLTTTSVGYKITDNSGNVMEFNAAGRIVQMMDTHGMHYDFQYDSNDRLSRMLDGIGRSAQLSYSTYNGLLTSVSYLSVFNSSASSRTVQFSYTNGDLTRITYPDGTYTQFAYSSIASGAVAECFATVNPETKQRQEYIKQVSTINRFNAIRSFTPTRYEQNGSTYSENKEGDAVRISHSHHLSSIGVSGKAKDIIVVDDDGRLILQYCNLAFGRTSELPTPCTPATVYEYETVPNWNNYGAASKSSRVVYQASTGAEAYKMVSGSPVKDETNLLLDGSFANGFSSTAWNFPGSDYTLYFLSPATPLFDSTDTYWELVMDRTNATAATAASRAEQTVSLSGVTLSENTLVLSAWCRMSAGNEDATTAKLTGRVTYSNGTCTERTFVYSGTTNSQLGAIALPLEAGLTPTAVKVTLSYVDNGAIVYFTNVRLTNEPGIRTTYNECENRTVSILGKTVTVKSSVTQTNGHTTQYEEYDAYGNCVRNTYTDEGGNSFVTTARYDSAQNLVKTRDYRGMVSDMTYAASGALLTEKTYHENSSSTYSIVQRVYDSVNDRYSKEYDEDGTTALPYATSYDTYGRPATLTGRGMTVSCGYDKGDRLLNYTATANGATRTVSHAYQSGLQYKVTANGMYYDTRKKLPADILSDEERALLTTDKHYEQAFTYIGTASNEETLYGPKLLWKTTGSDASGADNTPVYDGFGRLKSRVDQKEQKSYRYYYDKQGNLLYEAVTPTGSSGGSSYYRRYTYDAAGRLTSSYDSLTAKTTTYTYEQNSAGVIYPDASILSLTEGGSKHTVTTDRFGRMTGSAVAPSGTSALVTNAITYPSGTVRSRPTGYTCTVGGTANAYTYTYDTNGNITEVRLNGVLQAKYTYDQWQQLVREDNYEYGKSWRWTYDARGNITDKEVAQHETGVAVENLLFLTNKYYTYRTNGWLDVLSSINGYSVISDNTYSCPIYYNNIDLTWEGSLLKKYSANTTTTFEYNSSNIRIAKETNGGKTTYTVDGTRIVREVRPDGSVLLYRYGVDGSVIGFTHNGASYYYGKNLFGDIVDIYTATGTKVAHYAYDAWGSHTVENLTTSAIGDLNPFRYRGYYYDDETKLYYLQTRYYDPNVGRFLSPDALAYLGADGELRVYNLYTYCGNNPVMNVDPTGHFSIIVTILVATLFGAALSSIGSVAHELSTYGLDLSKWNWELIGSKALLGAASGLAMGLGAAAAGMVLGSVALIGSMTTTQSVVTLLGIAAGVNFAAGIGAYAIEAEEFNILYGIYKGVGQTARGVLDFFTAAMMVGAGWWPLRDLKLKETVGWAIKRGVAKYVGNFVLNNVIEELF